MYAPTITMSTEHRQTRYQRVMMFFVLMEMFFAGPRHPLDHSQHK